MTKRIVISGCSGGGKSSLLAELAGRGHATYPEPGRLVVQAEQARGGRGLPWADEYRFAELVIDIARDQWVSAPGTLCFYDRSLIDAVTWYERQSTPVPDDIAALVGQYRYASRVFLAPPWPEIYVQDTARQHGLAAAIAEYDALLESYPAKGYTVAIIPKMSIAARADWLIDQLDGAG